MLWTALFIGFTGSIHCIGMCAPLAWAIPANGIASHFFLTRLIYNLGRCISYASMGLITGLIGNKMTLISSSQRMSVITGILILTIVFFSLLQKREVSLFANNWFLSKIKKSISKFMQHKTTVGSLLVGLLNGFLPCGLVYIALTASLSTSSPWEGMLYMFLFGLGTFPLMFIVAISKKMLPMTWIQKLGNFNIYFSLLIGVLFIIRGLNLNIPYLSPELDKTPSCQTTEN